MIKLITLAKLIKGLIYQAVQLLYLINELFKIFMS